MNRPNPRVSSLFHSKVSTTPKHETLSSRLSFDFRHNPKLSKATKQHSNDQSWDLSVRASLLRKEKKEIGFVPSAVQTDIPQIKQNVTSHAPVVVSSTQPAPLNTILRIAPSSMPTTFFTAPTTPIPILLSPTQPPSLQPVVRTTPTLAPESSIVTSPVTSPLSPLSQGSSNLLSPDTAMPSASNHGPVTLLTVLGAALASLVLSLLVLRARHRYVQRHGAASTRRRKRQSTLKMENAVPVGIEIQGSTVESQEAVDLEDESL